MFRFCKPQGGRFTLWSLVAAFSYNRCAGWWPGTSTTGLFGTIVVPPVGFSLSFFLGSGTRSFFFRDGTMGAVYKCFYGQDPLAGFFFLKVPRGYILPLAETPLSIAIPGWQTDGTRICSGNVFCFLFPLNAPSELLPDESKGHWWELGTNL